MNFALADGTDGRAESIGLLDIMRGEKDSAALRVYVTDRVDNEPAAIYVKPGVWFVRDED